MECYDNHFTGSCEFLVMTLYGSKMLILSPALAKACLCLGCWDLVLVIDVCGKYKTDYC